MICNLQRFTPTRTPPATLVKSCHGSRTTNSSSYARLSVRIRHRSLSVAPRIFPLSGFVVIPASDRVEEEKWPWYTPRSFYPVRIGEVFQCRYQVLYKLGYGTTSTVWMCRDLSRNELVCMKAMVSNYPSVERELRAFELLATASTLSKTIGKKHVRHAVDQFKLDHAGRTYQFLIHDPLGFPFSQLHEMPGYTLPLERAQFSVLEVLKAVYYLHINAYVIHTDIQTRNMLLSVENPEVLTEMEDLELAQPSARKITAETAVFVSREPHGECERWIGDKSSLVLCDFGEARQGGSSHTGLIQPGPFRAPEVILEIPWSEPVDIWNVGCVSWNMMFGTHLFPRKASVDNAGEEVKTKEDMHHLARMVALLGRPPAELLQKAGPRALHFFYANGTPKVEVPNISFESLLEENLKRIDQPLERERFLRFLRRCLTWTAETRATVIDLILEYESWVPKDPQSPM